MTSLIVLIHHIGEWDSKNNYVGYSMDEVVITIDIDFSKFIHLILNHLNVDTSINSFEFRYKIDEDSIPMMIHNTMGVTSIHRIEKRKSSNFD